MNRIILPVLMLLLIFAATSNASWLIFHKPEFKGKIVDIETNEPIEGAVVVAVYRVHSLAVADSVDYDIGAQEALTDKNGEFRIPSYSTMIQPFSWSIPVQFVIFKPGYVCNIPLNFEDEFSGNGNRPDRDISAQWNQKLTYRILKSGTVMLRKIDGKDRIECASRLNSISKFPKELLIANKMKIDENKFVLTLH